MRKIGICGCGNMGAAIVAGMTQSKYFSSNRINLFDPDHGRAKRLGKKFHARYKSSAGALIEDSQFIILAMKPQSFDEFCRQAREHIHSKKIIISIMAGIAMSRIRKGLGGGFPLARVMPNMPATLGRGISAVSFGRGLTNTEKIIIKNIFLSVGEVLVVSESKLDAVTALSGSGPAYVFYLADALVCAGGKMGLSKKESEKLAYNTLLGSAGMLLEGDLDPAALIARVSSKGGTTLAALNILKKNKVQPAFVKAVLAARKRAQALSKE